MEAFQRDLAAAEQNLTKAHNATEAATARADAAERERDAAEAAAAMSDRLRQDVEAEAEVRAVRGITTPHFAHTLCSASVAGHLVCP